MASLGIATRYSSSFTFRSDVSNDERDGHKSGILHALRSSDLGREEHAFAWLDDGTCGSGVGSVVSHLESFGFDRRRMAFIPYGTMEDWMHRYPHACPYMRCDADGVVTGVSSLQHRINDNDMNGGRDAAAADRPAKRQRRGGSASRNAPKLFPDAVLSNPERSCLHLEIYKYLVWLLSQLTDLRATEGGRRRIGREGISVLAIQNVLTKLEASFPVVREFKKTEDEDCDGGDGGRSGGKSNDDGGDGDASGGNEGTFARDDSEKENNAPKLPLLEEYLKLHLGTAVKEAEETKGENDVDSCEEGQNPSFETMYQRLLAYREQNGHINVPQRHKDRNHKDRILGHWVNNLRRRSRELRRRGLEFEVDPACRNSRKTVMVSGGSLGLRFRFFEGKQGATVIGMDPDSGLIDEVKVGDRLLTVDGSTVARMEDLDDGNDGEVRTLVFEVVKKRPSHYQQSWSLLLKERVELLNSIGFAWRSPHARKIIPWDERFEMLKRYKEEHGRWPTRDEKWNDHHIGTWCHKQRVFYSTKDKNFMAERAPKLDEIGFPWMMRGTNGTPPESIWGDHFKKLEEFWRNNGHFNVPRPEGDEWAEREVGSGPSEAVRFYRWVNNIHLGYRNYKSGQGAKYGLNEERIHLLLGLGFKFEEKERRGPTDKDVPDIPFEKRLEQVTSVRDQLGHLNIDFRFGGLDNLGGWAAKMSKLYKEWREGKLALSHVEEGQFSQLAALGFEFNVFPVLERRSWEDNFNSFIEFRQQHGHGLVPISYKADRRLGSWAGITRTQYKLFREGKMSTLTKERYERLNEAGFVWEPEAGRKIFPKSY